MDNKGYRHVLLDTNAFGGGKCTDSDLENVRRLVASGANVYVPDVVVHELSAHVGNEIARLNQAALSLVVGSDAVRQLDDWRDSNHAFNQIKAHLHSAGAEVKSSRDHWWRLAVLDQIASTPPASRKGETTTGAVDAMVTRHAAVSHNLHGETLVVTSDKALQSHLESISVAVAAEMQEAIGLVADNASPELTREVGRAMIFDPSWKADFVTLIPVHTFSSKSQLTIDIIGLSNLSHTVAGLTATIMMAIDATDKVVDQEGEYDRLVGTDIYSAEAILDADTHKPQTLFSIHSADGAFDYLGYPGPINADEYVSGERACLPSPQAEATFTITTSNERPNSIEVFGKLGNVLAAQVSLTTSDVPFEDPTHGAYMAQFTDIAVSGPVTRVTAKRRPTFRGYLGSRMFTLWLGGEVISRSQD